MSVSVQVSRLLTFERCCHGISHSGSRSAPNGQLDYVVWNPSYAKYNASAIVKYNACCDDSECLSNGCNKSLASHVDSDINVGGLIISY